jgi:hypothetical protein
MNKRFARTLLALSIFLATALYASAQQNDAQKTTATPTVTVTASAPVTNTNIKITAATSPIDLARAAVASLGGEKYLKLENMVLSGSADLYAPNQTTALPGKFVMVYASGDRYRLEIQSPAFNFRQIYDGQNSFTSVRGFDIPPPSKLGIGVLSKYDRPGYTVTALPDKKKQRAFRITDPEGNATDFFVDGETGRLMSYSYPYMGNTIGIEHKTYKEVEGISIPYTFVQKFETPQGSFFAEYKVKDVKLNITLADDVFDIPEK